LGEAVEYTDFQFGPRQMMMNPAFSVPKVGPRSFYLN
jgi:hypothetical protein